MILFGGLGSFLIHLLLWAFVTLKLKLIFKMPSTDQSQTDQLEDNLTETLEAQQSRHQPVLHNH